MRRLLLAALLCLIGAAAHAQAPAWQHNGTTSANVLPNSPTNPSYVAPATGAGTTDVNLKQVGGVATAVGAGAVTAGTPRVTLASDDPAVSGITTTNTDLGPPGATACATDTGSCSLNALLQRLAQRLTTINTTLGTPMQATGGTVGVTGGPTASGASLTANPLTTGCRATSSEPTAVTDGQVVNQECTLTGKLVVLPYAFNENLVSGAITSAMTGTTSTSLLAAPAGSLRNYITNITCSNAHATVGTDIVIQDGSGGTTLYTLPAAANYGGATIPFPAALRQPTAATAIFVANVTTGASTKCSASGYKGL